MFARPTDIGELHYPRPIKHHVGCGEVAVREAHLIMQVCQARADLDQNLQRKLGRKQPTELGIHAGSAAAAAARASALVVDEVEEAAPGAEFADQQHVGGSMREHDPKILDHVLVLQDGERPDIAHQLLRLADAYTRSPLQHTAAARRERRWRRRRDLVVHLRHERLPGRSGKLLKGAELPKPAGQHRLRHRPRRHVPRQIPILRPSRPASFFSPRLVMRVIIG